MPAAGSKVRGLVVTGSGAKLTWRDVRFESVTLKSGQSLCQPSRAAGTGSTAFHYTGAAIADQDISFRVGD